jgi:hypothetical protein
MGLERLWWETLATTIDLRFAMLREGNVTAIIAAIQLAVAVIYFGPVFGLGLK